MGAPSLFITKNTCRKGELILNEMNAIELKNITKRFGSVVANDHVDLTLKEGEILAILGENGSGKTTLMNMLSGIYFPDEGQLFVHGKETVIRSPKDSYDLGIGMIHQHFKLIPIFTAAENAVLGLDKDKKGGIAEVNRKIREIIDKYGFDLDLNRKIYDMSVSQKQTVEIVKVLYRGADILILDEPTAVLTPQETEKLFAVLRNMKASGKSIIIITHKLNEVMEISDRVAVLRKGKSIGTIETKDASVEILTEMMVGEKVALNIDRSEPKDPKKCINVSNLSVRNREGVQILKNISFEARSGEILGIAGVSGNGQEQLLEAIAGLEKYESGKITFYDNDGKETNDKVISFVPEDRLGMGLVGNMNIVDNMMLRSYRETKGFFLDKSKPLETAKKIVDSLKVVTPDLKTAVRRLSGGNVQKVLVGREIARDPELLMVAYPVRGLDINSSYAIYNLLNEQKNKGVAVICVIEDLDVLLELCDRILVLSGGKVTGIEDARTATKEKIGMLMMDSGKVENE
ncbi:simple sugar transport system ATP-binding protein [Lachnospiraceae bacterium]|nr:simple sugar transport system ATP-binding protein [Lachnospiraceae bacterium]